MTYREHLQELCDRQEKSNAEFMKLHNEIIRVNGFGDINLVPKYKTAEDQWKKDHNEFHTTLAHYRDQQINLDDTM